MREVAIVSGGMTRFGELWESSLRDMFVEALGFACAGQGADAARPPFGSAGSPLMRGTAT